MADGSDGGDEQIIPFADFREQNTFSFASLKNGWRPDFFAILGLS